MIISYQGVESFKISQGDLTLALNPISKDSRLVGGQAKLKPARFGADITLITTNHPDLNGADNTSRGEKESFVISGPGEYEVQGVSIKGFESLSKYGGSERINTIYLISFEGLNLCFLGALSNGALDPKALEHLEDIDILFVPIGGEGVLDAAAAYKLAVSLEPGIIIPMHYPSTGSGQVGPGDKEALKVFLKEGGEESVEALDKLVVKKKDMEGKEGDIIVLKEE